MKKNISIALVMLLAFGAMTASADTDSATISSSGVVSSPSTPLVENGLPVQLHYNDNDVRPMEKNIPGTGDRMYTGGTPCFDERTGKNLCDKNGLIPKPPVRKDIPTINAGFKDARQEAQAERKDFRAEATTAAKNLRVEVKENRADVRGDFKELRVGTTAEIKDMRGEVKLMMASGTPIQIKEMRDQMEERAKALRASTTVARAEMKDEALKKRLEIAHKQAELVNKRIEAAIERVQTLTNRLSTSLNNLSTKGVNVDASRAKLAEATAKLDIARAKAAEIKLATEATFASETPKEALKEVQGLVKEGTTIIQAAHKNVAEAISLVKPGINKQATTTTSVTATTNTDATATATTTQ